MAGPSGLFNTSAPPQSSKLTERVTNWASDNRKVLLGLVAGAVLVGGGYYIYSTNTAPSSGGKKSKRSPRRKSRTSAATATESDAEKGVGHAPVQVNGTAKDDADILQMGAEQMAVLPLAKRKELADELKSRGNKQYSARKYAQAAELYTKAIEFDEQAVFYSNRAACHNNLNDTKAVIADCDSALRLDRVYLKAINRRAQAYESLGTEEALYEALCDYTAACILEQFQKKETSDRVERILAQLSSRAASRILAERQPRLPSHTFITAYLNAFRRKNKPSLPESPSDGDRTLLMAFDAVAANDFPHAVTLFNESIEQGFSTNELHARALNMRATFRFIMGMANDALEDLNFSSTLNANDTQTWVKKASVHMELGDVQTAMEDFAKAESINGDDPDIYYHRGQVYFIQEKYDQAMTEYKKSTALDDSFIYSQVQYAVALYKGERKEKAVQAFKKLLRKFGNDYGDAHNYYGELLLDRGDFAEAARSFDTAIALEKRKPSPINVLPMVNKALCVYQSEKNFSLAEQLCRDALAEDENCDVAVATYAQLLLQHNKVQEAAKMFARTADLARTEKELENALNFQYATQAQIRFIETYPNQAQHFGLTEQRPLTD